MGIEFYASAPGITYTAQTSTDMEAWVSDGVTLSDPDAEGTRTATVARDGPRRFMRLVVAASHGGECLSKRYKNAVTKLRWRCAKGHEWMATPNYLRNSGKWCPVCARRRRCPRFTSAPCWAP